MKSRPLFRGSELASGTRSWLSGTGGLARLWAGGMEHVLKRIDRGLERGAIEARLPDGTRRRLGGRAPGFEAIVELRSWRALARLATAGSIGWYQAWEAGEWDSPDPVPLFALFMANATSLGGTARASGPWRLLARCLHWLNRNNRTGAQRNIHAHYDLGNDFYAAWLDELTLSYSSAFFFRPGMKRESLIAGQQNKMSLISERLRPEQGQTLLEIGCGWGTLAWAFAEQFGCKVTAISISDQQLEWARAKHLQAPRLWLTYEKRDYRDQHGQFDMIASVEMVEALGREYWPAFMDCIARCLKPGGRAAIQFILIRDELFEAYASSVDFIQAYIFPGGMLIKESEFRSLAEARGLSWERPAYFGEDYADTLMIWRGRFDHAVKTGRLPSGFDERFIRLWRYYLMYCEGGFRGGGIDVAQVTLVKQA
jgi:cyclopropane-fatty-acyl-phospholipid synthase